MKKKTMEKEWWYEVQLGGGLTMKVPTVDMVFLERAIRAAPLTVGTLRFRRRVRSMVIKRLRQAIVAGRFELVRG